MTYCEDFAKQFKVGDKVYVLRKADSHESGWNDTWTAKMDAYVGMVQTISLIADDSVYFADGIYAFPPFVLEKIVTENPFKVGDTVKVRNVKRDVSVIIERVDALYVYANSSFYRHQFCTLVKPYKKQWKLGCQTFSWEGDKFTSGIYFAKLNILKTIYEQATSDFPPSSWVLHGAEITLDNKCFYYGKELTVLGNIKLLKEILDANPGNPSS